MHYKKQPIPIRHFAIGESRGVGRIIHNVFHAVFELLLQLLLRACRHHSQVLLLQRLLLRAVVLPLSPPSLLLPLSLHLTPPSRRHRHVHLTHELLAQLRHTPVEPRGLVIDLPSHSRHTPTSSSARPMNSVCNDSADCRKRSALKSSASSAGSFSEAA